VSIKPEVTAPGTQIYSTFPGNNYGILSGTSMACPHTSGAVAILRQVNPDMLVDEVKTALMVTAFDRGPVGEDNDYGWGIIDVGAAVEYAKQTIPNYPPANLTAVLTDDDVAMTWNPPQTFNQYNLVTKYRIYRALEGEPYPLTPLAELNPVNVAYTDYDIPFGSWKYVVTAVHQNGESGPTNEGSALLPFAGPRNFTGAAVVDSIQLSWDHPEPIKPESPVLQYRLYRDLPGDTLGFELLAEIPDTVAALEHLDPDLPYTTYRYYATAVYGSGESPATDTLDVPLPLPVARDLSAFGSTDTLDADVLLSWRRPIGIRDDDSLLVYRVHRFVNGNPLTQEPIGSLADNADTVRYLDLSGLSERHERGVE
jgi:hypothetical protein